MKAPITGKTYRAGDLPAGSIVTTTTGAEYVRCTRIDSLMRWEQPIPGSEDWQVTYVGQLPAGETMTEREKREVADAAQRRPRTRTWIVTQTEQFRVRAATAEYAKELVAEDTGEHPDVEWMACTERSAEPA